MNIETFDKYLKEADDLMKESNGHYFVTILKTRCQYCGRSPKVATRRCALWFQTFTIRLKEVFIKHGEIGL